MTRADGGEVEECMLCLGRGKRMCIVPCGHTLCGGCGEPRLFSGAEGRHRPFSRCPVCQGDMCEPWVMECGEWEALGGRAYDP